MNPYIVEDRRMISRSAANRIKITHTIQPGRRSRGLLTCCHAPEPSSSSSFSVLLRPLTRCLFCFFDHPRRVVNEREASRYVYVRENSLEWNDPEIVPDRGGCCGSSCAASTVRDDVTVLYFDDADFDEVRATEDRCCSATRSACCGDRGERVVIDSSFCFGGCRRSGRGRGLCRARPSCCPANCCPCGARPTELWVENAEMSARIIRDARDDAMSRLQLA